MAKRPQILLIEDCEDSAFLLKMAVQPYGVIHAATLAAAREALAASHIDLIFIDVGLPDGDGFKFCNELSTDSKYKSIPKILVSGRAAADDKVLGLNCGADDYITKPFHAGELKARLEARLRQMTSSDAAVFIFSRFEFDRTLGRCLVNSDGNKVDLNLTPTEFRVFFILARNQGSPMSRHDLVTQIWKASGLHIEERVIDTHIAHLRKKLGAQGDIIVSVYGQGYVIADDEWREEAA